MSLFSNQLMVALEGLRMSQSQLSEEAGVPISQVNKYARGFYRPSPEVLEKLCLALPERHRAAVAAAHLRDELPPSANTLVKVVVDGEKVEPTPLSLNPQLRKELREMFEFFHSAVIEDEAIADWLLSSYRLMQS